MNEIAWLSPGSKDQAGYKTWKTEQIWSFIVDNILQYIFFKPKFDNVMQWKHFPYQFHFVSAIHWQIPISKGW